MTNAKFARECDGLATVLASVAKQAGILPGDDKLQHDKTSGPILVSELRNLADEIEKAAVV